MLLVDTNVLVYAADADSPYHAACRAWLENRRRSADAWYLTWSILYEFLRVTTHPRVMRKPWTAPHAWIFARSLLSASGLGILVPTQRHAAVVEAVLTELPQLTGNLFHDAHTAILMREHGISQICTRDTDFHRFSFLEVVDPVAH